MNYRNLHSQRCSLKIVNSHLKKLHRNHTRWIIYTNNTPAHKIRGDQRSMIGKNQVMIADMSLMPITLIGHISPKKTTWEQFKSFQRSLEHKFITFFLSSATKEQLKLEIFFTSWLMLDEASSRKYEHHSVCLPFTHLFIYDNHGNRNCLH